MYVITGYLYKNDKCILRGMIEDLEDFVEELKKLNKEYVGKALFWESDENENRR